MKDIPNARSVTQPKTVTGKSVYGLNKFHALRTDSCLKPEVAIIAEPREPISRNLDRPFEPSREPGRRTHE